jgi:hypothetical protein
MRTNRLVQRSSILDYLNRAISFGIICCVTQVPSLEGLTMSPGGTSVQTTRRRNNSNNSETNYTTFIRMIQILTLTTFIFNCFIESERFTWRFHVHSKNPHGQIQQPGKAFFSKIVGSNHTKSIIVFLHIHKCAGTFFIDLIRKLPDQRVPSNDGLIVCPFLKARSSRLKQMCGTSENAVMPFWTWPPRIQAEYFHKLNYTFVANERWLGHRMASEELGASHPLHVKYITIIRNPLDRIASHFHYAQLYPASTLHGRNLSFASFVRAGPCREPDAGFRCWDANHFIQVLSTIIHNSRCFKNFMNLCIVKIEVCVQLFRSWLVQIVVTN